MKTVTYHLAYTGTTFAAGMGQLTLVRPGKIVGARMVWAGIAGGGGTFGGNASLYLNQNSINDTLTSNPPRETFLMSIAAWAVASGGIASTSGTGFVPLNIPVIQGDMLSINGGNSGTAAPASSHLMADVYVMES